MCCRINSWMERQAGFQATGVVDMAVLLQLYLVSINFVLWWPFYCRVTQSNSTVKYSVTHHSCEAYIIIYAVMSQHVFAFCSLLRSRLRRKSAPNSAVLQNLSERKLLSGFAILFVECLLLIWLYQLCGCVNCFLF